MAIQLKNGEVFFAVPKTGSTHVYRILNELGLIQKPSTHKHANFEYLLSYEPQFLYNRTFEPRNLKRGTSIFGISPKNVPSFMFVRDPLTWLESYYSYSKQRGLRKWGNGSGIQGQNLKRYYWHPWRELMQRPMESFDGFIEGVINHCPGYVSRMYFSYIMNEHTLIGRQEELNTDLTLILQHYDYQINNLDSLIPQKSNESKKNIVWNEELKSAIRTLESPYYSFDWNSRLRNQIKQS